MSFLGGSTDVASFYEKHTSLVIGTAITQYCYLNCRYTPEILPHRVYVNYAINEHVNDYKHLKHNGARGVLQFLNFTKGVECSYLGDVSSRTGLGSSSSFCVGLLNCLHALRGETITKKQLAQEAITVERSPNILYECGGIQDQLWAAFGGLNSIEISKDGSFKVRPIPVCEEFLNDFKQHILLLYLGKERKSFAVAQSTDSIDKKVLDYKKQMLDFAHKGLIAFQNENILEIGTLLNSSWQYKRQLSDLVSNDRIDKIYDRAMGNNAIGFKLLGAGAGGFCLIIVEPKYRQNMIDMLGLIPLEFGIDQYGSKIIYKSS